MTLYYNERFCVALNTIYIVRYTLQLKYFAKAWSAQTLTLIVNVILQRRISKIYVHLSLNCQPSDMERQNVMIPIE